MLVARRNEIELLSEIMKSQAAEFVAIYGRRRVGKTYLIGEFFKDKGLFFELTGRKNATKSAQLRNFATVFADAFNQGRLSEIPKDWDEALNALRYKIEAIESSKKVIIRSEERRVGKECRL